MSVGRVHQALAQFVRIETKRIARSKFNILQNKKKLFQPIHSLIDCQPFHTHSHVTSNMSSIYAMNFADLDEILCENVMECVVNVNTVHRSRRKISNTIFAQFPYYVMRRFSSEGMKSWIYSKMKWNANPLGKLLLNYTEWEVCETVNNFQLAFIRPEFETSDYLTIHYPITPLCAPHRPFLFLSLSHRLFYTYSHSDTSKIIEKWNEV